MVVTYMSVSKSRLKSPCRWQSDREEIPEKASSGRTRRSRFLGERASRMTLARAMFSVGLPSKGLNCKQPIRILERGGELGCN